ncbi:helix-turn-helix domain-containing protein [Myroides ceti]|uniref:Helix-turn-helix domain-containing protein n=1 Tax=Paenimyroides ceti TaxID=395087 RepID=A0ABT8CMZ6_9FLAO|nr:helix-turn-helix domain-containing protein [Paenimyroides ceti]MDN3705872.1 helix-turn-helix domain-containing protein [Paenimyroides ceti]
MPIKSKPDYNRIYKDLVESWFPEQKEELVSLISVDITTSLDVIQVNNKLFNKKSKDTQNYNQKLRSYDIPSIIRIVGYQQENFLTIKEISELFGVSRNTVAKWKDKVTGSVL